MLIAVAGSQGTGKTTLINALQYPSITRKTSRSILSEWNVSLSQVNNDRELTVRFQDEILKRKLEDESETVASDQLFVTERTYADLFVYALVAIGKDNEYSDWLDGYYQRCVDAQKSYSRIFYLIGGHFKPVADGVRATNEHYSRLVDLVMYDYTCKMSRSVTTIETANLDLRVQIIKDALYGRINPEQL